MAQEFAGDDLCRAVRAPLRSGPAVPFPVGEDRAATPADDQQRSGSGPPDDVPA